MAANVVEWNELDDTKRETWHYDFSKGDDYGLQGIPRCIMLKSAAEKTEKGLEESEILDGRYKEAVGEEYGEVLRIEIDPHSRTHTVVTLAATTIYTYVALVRCKPLHSLESYHHYFIFSNEFSLPQIGPFPCVGLYTVQPILCFTAIHFHMPSHAAHKTHTYTHTYIHTHTHTHIHTYIHTHTFSLPLLLYLSLTHSFTHSLIHSLTHSLTPSSSHSLIHSLSLSHSHTHTLFHSLTYELLFF